MSEVVDASSEVVSSEPVINENDSQVQQEGVKKSEEKLTPQTQAERAKNIQKFKLKVDGEEIDFEADVNDPELLKKHFQMSYAADKRFREISEKKRELYDLAQKMNNPLEYLSTLGDKGYEAAEKFLWDKIQHDGLSPEQKKMMEYEKRLAKYEEQEKIAKQQEEEQKQKALEKQYADKFQNLIMSAIDKYELPKTTKTVKLIAEKMQIALMNGIELDAYDIAQIVEREQIEEAKAFNKHLTPEKIEQILGEEHIKKVNQYAYNKYMTKRKMKTAAQIQTPSYASNKMLDSRPKRFSDWSEEIDERIKKS